VILIGPRYNAPKLESNPDKLWSLNEMERTGGEPDVVGRDTETGRIRFFRLFSGKPSRSQEPIYDREALDQGRSTNQKIMLLMWQRPWGIELLTEAQYRALQTLGNFDTKTSSWVKTPADIRKLGGASSL